MAKTNVSMKDNEGAVPIHLDLPFHQGSFLATLGDRNSRSNCSVAGLIISNSAMSLNVRMGSDAYSSFSTFPISHLHFWTAPYRSSLP